MIRVFIAYSHADEALRQELDKHLMSLKRQGLVEVWHDPRIGAGEEWAEKIDARARWLGSIARNRQLVWTLIKQPARTEDVQRP